MRTSRPGWMNGVAVVVTLLVVGRWLWSRYMERHTPVLDGLSGQIVEAFWRGFNEELR